MPKSPIVSNKEAENSKQISRNLNPLLKINSNSNKMKPESKKAPPKNIGMQGIQRAISTKATPEYIRKQEEESDQKLKA